MSIEMSNVGKITQIIGAVLDIKFTGGSLPEINEAIKIATKDGGELIVEVSQQGHGCGSHRRTHYGSGRREYIGAYFQCIRAAHR